MELWPVTRAEADDLVGLVNTFNDVSKKTSSLRPRILRIGELETAAGLPPSEPRLIATQLRLEAERDQVHARLQDFVNGASVSRWTPGSLGQFQLIPFLPWIVGGLATAGVAVWGWIQGVNNHTHEIENREKELALLEEGKTLPSSGSASLLEKTVGLSGSNLVLFGLGAVLIVAMLKRGIR